MKFIIRGNKIDVTPAIKNYIENKIGKLEKYFDKASEVTANVVIKVRGVEQIVEVTIPIKKIILRGEDSHKDLYAAIDLVSEKIERQIRKNKTKLKRKNSVDYSFNIDAIDNDDSAEKVIVKRKNIDMKPMSEEEAILQMEMLGHEFFVFKSADTNNVDILYRRKDGNYGIIMTN
ncbi:MAG: ribosome-associated translation inhibitor RaiA [Bacilli bacterium]|nr:ribosome-associated translation inhibitor RaiA [Bacilli bacterium]